MFLRLLLLPILAGGTLFGFGSSSPQGAVTYSSSEFRGSTSLRRAVEEAEKSFFQSTGFIPGDTPPVQLSTREKGSPASLSVNAIEGGGPQIRLVLPKDPEDLQVPQFLATALLLRQYYGKIAPVPGSAVPQYPRWMTRGLGTLTLRRSVPEAATSAPPELEAFLTERVPDPENTALLRRYDAMASVLVRSGLSDDSCKKAFRDWIGSYDPSVPSHHQSAWVEGWDMRTIERRWNLGLQAPGHNDQLPGMIQSAPSTLKEFHTIMVEGRVGKDSLADVAREKGGEYRLQMLTERLTALRLQANPLTIPLLESSMKLVSTAKRMSPKKVRQEEERLRQECLVLEKKSRAIEDYLNWCEATKVMIRSGLFDSYLSAPASPKAKGPVGRQLDAVEARGWQGKE
jgi:hypothetical protein